MQAIKARRVVASVAAIAGAAALLAGCGAAESSDQSSTSSIPSSTESREALVTRDVTVVFDNRTNDSVEVRMGSGSGDASRSLAPNKKFQFTGFNPDGTDVFGFLEYDLNGPDNKTVLFKAKNPLVGYPWVSFKDSASPEQSKTFSVGTTWTPNVGTHSYKVERLADANGSKRFVVVLAS